MKNPTIELLEMQLLKIQDNIEVMDLHINDFDQTLREAREARASYEGQAKSIQASILKLCDHTPESLMAEKEDLDRMRDRVEADRWVGEIFRVAGQARRSTKGRRK